MTAESIRILRNLEKITSWGGTMALIRVIYPDIEEKTLRRHMRYAGLLGARGRRVWNHPVWKSQLLKMESSPHNNSIVQTYESLKDIHPQPVENGSLIEHKRKLALKTIEHYLLHTRKPIYTADGVYSVIHAHNHGHSQMRNCRECGSSIWTFHNTQGCPVCGPPQRRTCEECGSHFYLDLDKPGRPDKYCGEACKKAAKYSQARQKRKLSR